MLSEPNAKSGKDRICSVCDVIEATRVGLGDLQPYMRPLSVPMHVWWWTMSSRMRSCAIGRWVGMGMSGSGTFCGLQI